MTGKYMYLLGLSLTVNALLLMLNSQLLYSSVHLATSYGLNRRDVQEQGLQLYPALSDNFSSTGYCPSDFAYSRKKLPQNLQVTFEDINELEPGSLRQLASIQKKEIDNQESIIAFLSQPTLNNFTFSYLHDNRNACSGGKVDFLIVTPSRPGDLERRSKLRRQDVYNFTRDVAVAKFKFVFFVGRPEQSSGSGNETQRKLDEEVSTYGDIVQVNFTDTYRNILLKAVSMLRWAATQCPVARFVIRADDDAKFDPRKAAAVLENVGGSYKNFVLGWMKVGEAPFRSKGSKWHLSVEEFPPPVLPNFVLGALQGFPMSTASLLYQAALRVKSVWLDDVFITGICAEKVGVPLLCHPDFTFKHKGK